MKTHTVITALFVGICLNLSAQEKFDNRLYNAPLRSETGQIRTICPCETAQFFNTRQNMYPNRPVIISQNCPQYTLGVSNSRAFEGLTLSDFFKRFKRKRKVSYSKGSHIIPLVGN
jgi:hypothetical protein